MYVVTCDSLDFGLMRVFSVLLSSQCAYLIIMVLLHVGPSGVIEAHGIIMMAKHLFSESRKEHH